MSDEIKIGDRVTCQSWGGDAYVVERIARGTAFFQGGGFWRLSSLSKVTQHPATDTERQAREFWERVYFDHRPRVSHGEVIHQRLVTPEEIAANHADAALAEWRKRWQKEG